MLWTWRAEHALQILTPPPEQQIGVDVVTVWRDNLDERRATNKMRMSRRDS
jgi:hypothetical protein